MGIFFNSVVWMEECCIRLLAGKELALNKFCGYLAGYPNTPDELKFHIEKNHHGKKVGAGRRRLLN